MSNEPNRGNVTRSARQSLRACVNEYAEAYEKKLFLEADRIRKADSKPNIIESHVLAAQRKLTEDDITSQNSPKSQYNNWILVYDALIFIDGLCAGITVNACSNILAARNQYKVFAVGFVVTLIIFVFLLIIKRRKL